MAAPTSVSRRALLRTAAIAGSGALALEACGADMADGPVLVARRTHRVALDPTDEAWNAQPEQTIELGPQDIALPMKRQAAVPTLGVRAMHDGTRLAFRLTWSDADASDLTVRVEDFRDACAVLLLPAGADAGLRSMGSAAVPATLLHWKADWQRDVDAGRQGLDAAYPNRSIDTYPIVFRTDPAKVDINTYVAAGATQWLPGLRVGNPISAAGRTTPVEKAIAYGFSTTTTAATQDAAGRGTRTAGGWAVTVTKPIEPTETGEVEIVPGAQLSCAFAVWSGGQHDAGSRKSPAKALHAVLVAP